MIPTTLPPMYPGVYKVWRDNRGNFNASFMYNRFDVPKKIYGNSRRKAHIIWDSIERDNYRGGVLLTGIKGAGKTELGKLIANNAIDKGLPVLLITDLPNTRNIQDFLSRLNNVVLFFDEFGKNFKKPEQEKLLNLMSDSNKNLVFIITENGEHMLSPLIIGRPGRIKFHLNFKKLPMSTLTDYLEDQKDLEYDFVLSLMDLYNKSHSITFDHIKAIVDEHRKHRDLPFNELINMLNLGSLKKPLEYVIKEIVDKKGKAYQVVHASPSRLDDEVIRQWHIELTIKPVDEKKKDEDEEKEKTEERPPNPDNPMPMNPFGPPITPDAIHLVLTDDNIVGYDPGKYITYKVKHGNNEFRITYEPLEGGIAPL